MITVPVSTIAFATSSADLRTAGSAIGISVKDALLAVNTEINYADISSAITPFNRIWTGGATSQFWNPMRSGGAMALNAEITRQGSITAYSDDFKLIFLMTLIALPLVFYSHSQERKASQANGILAW